jgi:hypothetical protein
VKRKFLDFNGSGVANQRVPTSASLIPRQVESLLFLTKGNVALELEGLLFRSRREIAWLPYPSLIPIVLLYCLSCYI